jgi:hypothetical protein
MPPKSQTPRTAAGIKALSDVADSIVNGGGSVPEKVKKAKEFIAKGEDEWDKANATKAPNKSRPAPAQKPAPTSAPSAALFPVPVAPVTGMDDDDGYEAIMRRKREREEMAENDRKWEEEEARMRLVDGDKEDVY